LLRSERHRIVILCEGRWDVIFLTKFLSSFIPNFERKVVVVESLSRLMSRLRNVKSPRCVFIFPFARKWKLSSIACSIIDYVLKYLLQIRSEQSISLLIIRDQNDEASEKSRAQKILNELVQGVKQRISKLMPSHQLLCDINAEKSVYIEAAFGLSLLSTGVQMLVRIVVISVSLECQLISALNNKFHRDRNLCKQMLHELEATCSKEEIVVKALSRLQSNVSTIPWLVAIKTFVESKVR